MSHFDKSLDFGQTPIWWRRGLLARLALQAAMYWLIRCRYMYIEIMQWHFSDFIQECVNFGCNSSILTTKEILFFFFQFWKYVWIFCELEERSLIFDDEQTRYSNIPTKHHTKKSKLLLKRPLYTYTARADNIFKALLKNAICLLWQFYL